MKLTKLVINNYKNISISLDNESNVIALIGNNGSGKSNILEALSIIFNHLYTKKEKDIPFNFTIEYTIGAGRMVNVEKRNSSVTCKINKISRADCYSDLPKQIVAIYSGEEDRLWKKCYAPLYFDFIKSIDRTEVSGLGDHSHFPQMLYINKFYWQISLLCLLLEEGNAGSDFCTSTLDIKAVNSIKFEFNSGNYDNYSDSNVKAFIQFIDIKSEYTLEEFRELIDSSDYTYDQVYKHLYVAFSPDRKKMLENIVIKYNQDNLDIEDFSEGEKKMLLIKAALEFAGQEDSLFILDEPDAHIHLNNKIQIVKVFDGYKDNRQIILTTHSPTLTDSLAEESLYMLNDGKLVSEKKQQILENVSGDFWNKFQQGAFISSKKPMILLVEGKHDKEHITNALISLKDVYGDLDFEIFKLNSEVHINPFLRGLYESDFDTSKIYIGLFDREKKIEDDLKNRKHFEQIDGKPFKKINKSDKENTNYFVTTLPKLGERKADCSIEMMYAPEKWEAAFQRAVNNTIGKTGDKSIKEYAEDVLADAKNILAADSRDFIADDFVHFGKLFELIREIKVYSEDLKKDKVELKKDLIKPKEVAIAKPVEKKSKPINIYTNKRNTEIFGEFVNQNEILIKAGSKLAPDVVPSYGHEQEKKRKEMLNEIADFREGHWVLSKDKKFFSPSGSINFATGGNMNGWDDWLIFESNLPLSTIREHNDTEDAK